MRPIPLIKRSLLWKAYIISIPFQGIAVFQGFASKIQIPELVFIPWCIAGFRDFKKILRDRFFIPADRIVLLWPLAMILPGVIRGITIPYLLEIAGAIYLVMIYFLIRLADRDHLPDMAIRTLICAATITALAGLAGWLTGTLFSLETLMAVAVEYPYLGNIYRGKGFTTTANMQASIIMTGLLLLIPYIMADKNRNRLWKINLLIMAAGFLVTFSKTVIPLIAGVLAVFWLQNMQRNHLKNRTNISRIWPVLFFIILASIYYFASHFYVSSDKEEETIEEFRQTISQFNHSVATFNFRGDQYFLIPTNYYFNKKAAIQAFIQTRGVGTGGGNFNRFVADLKEQGNYPPYLPDYDPHSSYTGTLAEHGLTGILALILLAGVLAGMARRNMQNNLGPAAIGLTSVLIAVSIEAISIDVMNFRHYWWIFGLIAVMNRNSLGRSLKEF